MGKEQQMIEYMVQDLVEMLTEAQGIEYDAAMRTIYDSQIYEKLVDIETGLYRESPSYVYGLLQDELNFGHIVQAEVQLIEQELNKDKQLGVGGYLKMNSS